ncbi:hypothetical protein LguiB_014145 [Lonicera macranthoides]
MSRMFTGTTTTNHIMEIKIQTPLSIQENLVAPISLEPQKLALEDISGNVADDKKRPRGGGCRIDGFVRVKKVPGNLSISARSGAHSFDASLVNISHVISHVSFGKTVSPKALSDLKRLHPYIGGNHDSSLVHSPSVPAAKFHFEPSAMHNTREFDILYALYHKRLCHYWWLFHGGFYTTLVKKVELL